MELMVVIGILAILMLAAIPYYLGQQQDAEVNNMLRDTKTIEDAAMRKYVSPSTDGWQDDIARDEEAEFEGDLSDFGLEGEGSNLYSLHDSLMGDIQRLYNRGGLEGYGIFIDGLYEGYVIALEPLEDSDGVNWIHPEHNYKESDEGQEGVESEDKHVDAKDFDWYEGLQHNYKVRFCGITFLEQMGEDTSEIEEFYIQISMDEKPEITNEFGLYRIRSNTSYDGYIELEEAYEEEVQDILTSPIPTEEVSHTNFDYVIEADEEPDGDIDATSVDVGYDVEIIRERDTSGGNYFIIGGDATGEATINYNHNSPFILNDTEVMVNNLNFFANDFFGEELDFTGSGRARYDNEDEVYILLESLNSNAGPSDLEQFVAMVRGALQYEWVYVDEMKTLITLFMEEELDMPISEEELGDVINSMPELFLTFYNDALEYESSTVTRDGKTMEKREKQLDPEGIITFLENDLQDFVDDIAPGTELPELSEEEIIGLASHIETFNTWYYDGKIYELEFELSELGPDTSYWSVDLHLDLSNYNEDGTYIHMPSNHSYYEDIIEQFEDMM